MAARYTFGPTIQFNNAEFTALLRQVANAASTRTFPESCNAKGLHLASAAIRHTEKADINRVAYEMGQVATRYVSKSAMNPKRLKRPKRIFADMDKNSLAYRIIVSRMRERGESFTEQEIVQKAVRMRGARLRAIGFIKSGWIYAVRELSKVVGYTGNQFIKYSKSDTARMTGLPKGFVRPAKPRLNGIVECVIGNSALLNNTGNPMPVAQRGLDKAFQEVVADMKQHLENRMWKLFRSYNAR